MTRENRKHVTVQHEQRTVAAAEVEALPDQPALHASLSVDAGQLPRGTRTRLVKPWPGCDKPLSGKPCAMRAMPKPSTCSRSSICGRPAFAGSLLLVILNSADLAPFRATRSAAQ